MKNRFRGLSESRKLEMLQMSVGEIYNAGYLDGYEIGYVVGVYNERTGACEEPAPKSPNQRRAELIQRVREFVESVFNPHWRIPNLEVINIDGRLYTAEFITNSEKRTVVTLLRKVGSKKVRFKGIAKCEPGEVFNADIGKAIALARALEIEIPQEFMEAVQPDEKVVGMVVFNEHSNKPKPTTVVSDGKFAGFAECHAESPYGINSKIIDDTHAEYEVPS